MTRHLCVLTVLGVGAVPDRAGADRPCWFPPPPCGYGYYTAPAYPAYPVAPAVWVVPAAPSAAAQGRPNLPARPAAPPRVELVPNPPAATATPTPAPAPPAETVRPASDWTPAAKPTAAPPPAIPDTLPPVNLPLAPPVPAPAAPDPKKPEALPPLVLPPDVPGGPTGVVPGSTSKASPLGGPSVQVLTASGTPKAAGTRTVGFFNHTGRAVELVVGGRAVTLPRKSYLHAEVPPAFRWRYNGNPAEAATVPDDAAGLDIVFRD